MEIINLVQRKEHHVHRIIRAGIISIALTSVKYRVSGDAHGMNLKDRLEIHLNRGCRCKEGGEKREADMINL